MSGIDPPPPQHKRLGRARLDGSRPEAAFAGIPISAGVAIGPVFRASEPEPKIKRHKILAADSAIAQATDQAARAARRAA
jgi:hypothetical protein